MLSAGLFLLGGLTIAGYATMVWLAYSAAGEPTGFQKELLATAKWLTHNGAVMLGAFIFGWLAGQVR